MTPILQQGKYYILVLEGRRQGQPRPKFASQTTTGIATEKSMPMPKERVRYQATIENWRRYRASNATD